MRSAMNSVPSTLAPSPAGPPKQFAVSVGIMFSTIIVVLQFTHQWEAATAFAATLCFFAGLEAFLNFCAGCWVFGYAIK